MAQRADAKAETHGRIVAAASKLMRAGGLAAASVPKVMRGAGLTVGGFYAHFASKEAMDAEILTTTLRAVWTSWFAGLEGREGVAWLAPVVKRYLSGAHRDAEEEGCALPATLSDLTHADEGTRAAVAEAFEMVLKEFEAHAPAGPGMSAREQSLATLALCVGGLTLARVLRGRPESDEILRACVKAALPEAAARGK